MQECKECKECKKTTGGLCNLCLTYEITEDKSAKPKYYIQTYGFIEIAKGKYRNIIKERKAIY